MLPTSSRVSFDRVDLGLSMLAFFFIFFCLARTTFEMIIAPMA